MKNPSFKKRVKRRINFLLNSQRRLLARGINVLPHIFTLGNALFGFASVIFAAEEEWVASAYCIFLGALMDAIDGRVARFVGISTELGVHLDSLADAISFCFAPAFLAYSFQMKKLGAVGILVPSIFLFAGLLRLARFNIISLTQTIYFLGLPTTMAGCFIAVVTLNVRDVMEGGRFFIILFPALLCFLGALMISSVPFPTFKKRLFKFRSNWHRAAAMILFAFIAIMRFNLLLLLLMSFYILGALFWASFLRSRHKRQIYLR